MVRCFGVGPVVVLAALAFGGPLATVADASTTYTVNTTSDSAPSGTECMGVAGDCSLRQALDKAVDGDTISIPASAAPYQLTSVVDIVHAVTISGAGARSTVIEGSSDTNGLFDDDDLSSTATVMIEGVTISGGSTSGSGGALDLTSGATFDLTGDTFTNDTASQAGGAIEASGTTVNVLDSTIGPGDTAGTSGGGLDNAGGVSSTVSVTDSTIAGDSAANGGGISSQGAPSALAITNLSFTTVAFNSASTAGGDLFAENTVPIAAISAGDSIVADGQAPSGGDCNNSANAYSSNTSNATDGTDTTGSPACGFSPQSDALADVRLGQLQNNGGQTDTIALAAGSPAIGLVSSNEGGCTPADQLGHARSGGTVCDAGALESGNGESPPQWSVAHDFATSPQANPSADSLGDAGTWSYMEAPWTTEAPPPAPTADTLLPNHGTNACGQFAWTGTSGTSIAYNATTAPLSCGTATGPMHSVVMQPSASDYAIVAWKSPVTGTVAIVGSFESMDASGGDGSNWFVENGSNTLATGVNTVGGSGEFDLGSQTVTQGQTVYFILGPSSSGDATADSTELSLTITAAPGACATSLTIDAVQVLADCISPASDGSFLATGHARFSDGVEIVEPGTLTPATLVLDPSSHTVTVSGGGGAGTLETGAGGIAIGSGTPVIHTQAVTETASGITGAALVSGITSALSLSGWTFASGSATPYLIPTSTGGGVVTDGRLALPAWLGGTVRFGSLESGGYASGVTGQLAVQATAVGQLRVLNGGISFKSSALGTAGLGLSAGELSYQSTGSDWTGTAALNFAKLAGLPVHVTINDGKLVSVSAAFGCGSQAACTGSGLPTLGPLNIEDASAQLSGLGAIEYTPGHNASASLTLSGGLIGQALSDRVIAGGSFSYALGGSFTATGTAGFEPLYGGRFAAPASLSSGRSAGDVVASLLAGGDAGIELTKATISYPAGGSLRIRGKGEVPPPRFPYRLLSGPLTITIHPPHISGSGPVELSVPGVIPLIGGLQFGAAQAKIGERSSSAAAVLRRYCAPHLGCASGIAVAVTFKYGFGGFYWKLDGHGSNGFVSHSVRGPLVKVKSGQRLVSIAVHGAGGAPRVELIAPGGRRRLTLASSGGFRNRTGALAWVNRTNRTEDFLVELPRAGTWTVKRLHGPRVSSVAVAVPR